MDNPEYTRKLVKEVLWFGYRPYYFLERPWKIFPHIWREIKWAWQRVFRGYDERVSWSIDYYLGKMMPLWIQGLIDNNIGVPSSLFDDDNHSKEALDRASDEWYRVILPAIAEGFASYIKMSDCEYETKSEYAELQNKFDKGFDLFREHFSDLWD